MREHRQHIIAAEDAHSPYILTVLGNPDEGFRDIVTHRYRPAHRQVQMCQWTFKQPISQFAQVTLCFIERHLSQLRLKGLSFVGRRKLDDPGEMQPSTCRAGNGRREGGGWHQHLFGQSGAIQSHHRRKRMQGARGIWIGSGWLLATIAQSQYGNGTVSYYLLRHATQQPALETRCPMTAHHNQVGLQGLCCIENGGGRSLRQNLSAYLNAIEKR